MFTKPLLSLPLRGFIARFGVGLSSITLPRTAAHAAATRKRVLSYSARLRGSVDKEVFVYILDTCHTSRESAYLMHEL